MKAVIYKSTGSWYIAKVADGSFYNARMKGIFKLDGITSTNPIAVGDEVNIELENAGENTAIITEIFPRKNYINRQSPRHKNQQHILAANLDQCLLLATLKDPKTSQGFIDRFLVAAEMYHVPSIIVFNKADIYKSKEEEKFLHLKDIYETIGYKVYLISMAKNIGMAELPQLFANKTTLISGHSGVGKSSLLNILLPQLDLRTQDVSGWSGKGMHTTTFAEMFDLPGNGKIIDTPGMREFGISNLDSKELSHYFLEMRNRLNNCQFNNCLHINEPDCAIKKAVLEQEIHEDRYISYMSILDSIEQPDY